MNPLALWCLAVILPFLGTSCQTSADLSEVKEQPSEFTSVFHYFEAGSRLFENYQGPLLIKNEAVSSDFEGHQAATAIPEKVKAATGWTDTETPCVGAK